MLNNKSILITGGTGSFGKKFVETVIERYKPKKLIIYSRDELKQYEMEQVFSVNKYPFMRYFIGDVRDLKRLITATEDVDVIIHAAALKQVPAAEYNPFEAIKTNILGAQNVIDAAIENQVLDVIALSTDKAAAPINLYGATKLCSDKLFISANNYTGTKKIRFSVVRYGNVMGSRGSVIPFFIKKKIDGVFPITDKRMTRFNITLQEGVDFVLNCLSKMWGGELFIPKMPSYNIVDLAKAIDEKCKIELTGIRPGEKLHEELFTQSDSYRTIDFEKYFVILPSFEPVWDVKKFLNESGDSQGKFIQEGLSYNSGENKIFLSIDEIKNLINENIT